MVVHIVYFLHMSTKSEGGWTFMALIFTITLVGHSCSPVRCGSCTT